MWSISSEHYFRARFDIFLKTTCDDVNVPLDEIKARLAPVGSSAATQQPMNHVQLQESIRLKLDITAIDSQNPDYWATHTIYTTYNSTDTTILDVLQRDLPGNYYDCVILSCESVDGNQ